MSSYQEYRFYKLDGVLSPAELEAVDELSSRGVVTQTQATFTYHYSDFRHDEKEVLLTYFDCLIYRASWGSTKLLFKFPATLIDLELLKQYHFEGKDHFYEGTRLSVTKHGGSLLLTASIHKEESSDWLTEDEPFIYLPSIRSETLRGNYTPLFALWLTLVQINYDQQLLPLPFNFPSGIIPADYRADLPIVNEIVGLFQGDIAWHVAAEELYGGQSTTITDYSLHLGLLSLGEKNELLRTALKGTVNIDLLIQKAIEQKLEKGSPKASESMTLDAIIDKVHLVALQLSKNGKKKN